MHQLQEIAALLLKNRTAAEDWGEMSRLGGDPCPKEVANTFLLHCLLDWQQKTNVAWAKGEELIRKLGEPDALWQTITSFSEPEWGSRYEEYGRPHRFRKGFTRLWPIAKDICEKYAGDARNIWCNKEPSEVLVTLSALGPNGAGEQLSRMIVGALRDCGQIHGPSDLKGDIHVCRVLGRAVFGKKANVENATELARQIHPEDPWQLDWPLWQVGSTYCRPGSPKCPQCYLKRCCAYNAAREGGEGESTPENWIFPVGEGIVIDDLNGRWSDAAFFDDENLPRQWYPAEPSAHVQDQNVWRQWLDFLEASPAASETLLLVARSRAREKVGAR